MSRRFTSRYFAVVVKALYAEFPKPATTVRLMELSGLPRHPIYSALRSLRSYGLAYPSGPAHFGRNQLMRVGARTRWSLSEVFVREIQNRVLMKETEPKHEPAPPNLRRVMLL